MEYTGGAVRYRSTANIKHHAPTTGDRYGIPCSSAQYDVLVARSVLSAGSLFPSFFPPYTIPMSVTSNRTPTPGIRVFICLQLPGNVPSGSGINDTCGPVSLGLCCLSIGMDEHRAFSGYIHRAERRYNLFLYRQLPL